MSRYIDADALKAKKTYSHERHEYIVPVAEIDWLPTVDAVPVVRCKDCKHYDGKWCLLLDMVNSDMGDWFCAYGERRTDEQQT